jgi:ferritin-like metal-binding protein YciE
MAMAFENLHDVLVDNLKDLLHAEKQLVRALPKMVRAASDSDLKQALEEHLEVTQNQVTRLNQVFASIESPPKAKKCLGMEGLIAEADEALEHKRDSEGAALDAAIIVAGQKVEHYEISAYGSARTLAEVLGYEEAAELLQETLDEESEANEKLTQIASEINQAAAEGAGEEEEDEDESESFATTRTGGSKNGSRRSPRRSR